jgi:hypothetical protein
LDGRKQRFSRFSAQKLSQTDSPTGGVFPEEDSSVDDQSSSDDHALVLSPRKRDRASTDGARVVAGMKKFRKSWDSKGEPKADKASKLDCSDLVVDTSMIDQPVSISDDQTGEDDRSSMASTDGRLDSVQHSLAVSEVAMKLDQYARKAVKGGSRSRRDGVVTPPYRGMTRSSSQLLTYDDEFEHCEPCFERVHGTAPRRVSDISTTSTSHSFDHMSDASLRNAITPLKPVTLVEPRTASSVALKLAQNVTEHLRTQLTVPTKVAAFCVSTVPEEEDELCNKILQLIASCEMLANEFQLYRAALHPTDCLVSTPTAISPPRAAASVRSGAMHQIWSHAASRADAIRDFKIFAVNCLHRVLSQADSSLAESPLEADDTHLVLRETVQLWQQSSM